MSQKIHKSTATKSKYNRRHKRNADPLWFVLGGAALVAIAMFAILRGNTAAKAPIEVAGAPALKVDRDQVDLGNKKLGQMVQVSFKLTNVGDQPLRFKEAPYIEVKEGC